MADSDDLTTNVKRKKLTYSNGGVPDLQGQDSEIHDGPSVEQRRNRKLCPHCKQELSLKTYKFHRRLYFDRVRRQCKCNYLLT